MARMFSYAFYAYVFVAGLAIKFERLVVKAAELVIASDFFFMTGQLQNDEVFTEHVGPDLRVMFESASGAIQEFFLFVDDTETLLANCVSTGEISGCFLFGVVEVIAHGALHCILFILL